MMSKIWMLLRLTYGGLVTRICFSRPTKFWPGKANYFPNTIFVFIGDHGIPGDAGNMFPRAWTEQRLTCEHVPLLIYAPRFLQPQRLPKICSQIDILPTIAGLC